MPESYQMLEQSRNKHRATAREALELLDRWLKFDWEECGYWETFESGKTGADLGREMCGKCIACHTRALLKQQEQTGVTVEGE